MLYDPKWEVETKAAPFTMEGVIAWLEKQTASAEYPWMDCSGRCLYGLYMASVGVPWAEARISPFTPDIHKPFRLEVYRVAHWEPHTFGAALKRARTASLSKGERS